MIGIPHKLSKALESRVHSAINEYSSATELDEKWSFIMKTVHQKSSELISLRSRWPSPVRHMAMVLLEVFCERKNDKKLVKRKTAIMIIAAPYYFCCSEDIIPDYSPGDGYDDDAFAFNYILKITKRTDKLCYEQVWKRFSELVDVT